MNSETKPVFFFEDKEVHKEIDLALLEQSKNVLNPDKSPPPTRPIESFEMINQINSILDENKITYQLQPIIVQKKGSELLLSRDQRANLLIEETPIDAWRFGRILIQWIFPDETNLQPGITAAFHERGIDMAFGLFNTFCYNHCVYGDKWYTTYNTKNSQRRMYQDMINGLIAWLHNFEQHLSLDRTIVKNMISTRFKEKTIDQTFDRIIGRLYRKAYNQAYGNKEGAPFNISTLSKFVQGLEQAMARLKSESVTLWEIYNVGTNLMKPEYVDIGAINENNHMWGQFLIEGFMPDVATTGEKG